MSTAGEYAKQTTTQPHIGSPSGSFPKGQVIACRCGVVCFMNKVVKASRKSAVTQPQPVNPLLQMVPWSMLSLATPYVESECSVICEWESHLDTASLRILHPDG